MLSLYTGALNAAGSSWQRTHNSIFLFANCCRPRPCNDASSLQTPHRHQPQPVAPLICRASGPVRLRRLQHQRHQLAPAAAAASCGAWGTAPSRAPCTARHQIQSKNQSLQSSSSTATLAMADWQSPSRHAAGQRFGPSSTAHRLNVCVPRPCQLWRPLICGQGAARGQPFR